jgi:hypothetical protein
MDKGGPSTGHLTKPTQANVKRFELEWHLPLEVGLPTHAALFDLTHDPPHAIADDLGGDEIETLLNLWMSLSDRHESAEAIAFVADAYRRRAGRQPERLPVRSS